VEGAEDLPAAAKREVFEECGLHVEPLRPAYIEEFCSAWVVCISHPRIDENTRYVLRSVSHLILLGYRPIDTLK
jgi:8-oxo-dGTP pyrophosphatase MutT (NUDIX family)